MTDDQSSGTERGTAWIIAVRVIAGVSTLFGVELFGGDFSVVWTAAALGVFVWCLCLVNFVIGLGWAAIDESVDENAAWPLVALIIINVLAAVASVWLIYFTNFIELVLGDPWWGWLLVASGFAGAAVVVLAWVIGTKPNR